MSLKTLIIHGRRMPGQKDSPRKGREHAELWTSNNNVVDYWNGDLDWTRHFDLHPVEPCAHYREGIKGYRPATWEWYKNNPKDQSLRCYDRATGERMLDIKGWRPIYLLETCGEVPGSIAYPLDTIRKFFARVSGSDRLTTTV